MPQIHAEYIRETPSFVHVSMEITSHMANQRSYQYGPYTLQKAADTKRPAAAAAAAVGAVGADEAAKSKKGVVKGDGSKSTKKSAEKGDVGHADKVYKFTMMSGNPGEKTIKQLRDYIRSIRSGAGKDTSKCTKFNEIITLLKTNYPDDEKINNLGQLDCDIINGFGDGDDDDGEGSDSGSDIGSDSGSSSDEEEQEELDDEDEQDGGGSPFDQLVSAAAESHVSYSLSDFASVASEEENDQANHALSALIDTASSATTSMDAASSPTTKKDRKKVPKAGEAGKAGKAGKAAKADGAVDAVNADDAVEGDTQAAKKKQPSATVRIDFWVYTGAVGPVVPVGSANDGNSAEGIDNKKKITEAANREGLLEAEQEAEVRPTTTTITSSALCISSSLLLSHTTAETLVDGTVNAEEKGPPKPPKQEFGVPKQKKAAGAEAAETVNVDFAGFEDKSCLLAYIGNKASEAARAVEAVEAGEAVGAAKAPGVVEKKKVFIFYTVAPEHKEPSATKPKGKPASKGPSETNGINGTTKITKNRQKVSVRDYVPSVLAENTVLDAMVDLVVRCVDDIPDYETSARVVQTIILSGVEYNEAQADGGDENKEDHTELVSMIAIKPDKPAVAVAADDPTGVVPGVESSSEKEGEKAAFGSDLEELTRALSAVFLNTNGKPNAIDEIVDKLYNIKLGNKIALLNFYEAASPPTEGAAGPKKLIVKSTDPSDIEKVDRKSDRYGVMMYPAVTESFMAIATKKGKPKADIFKLIQNPPLLDNNNLTSLAGQASISNPVEEESKSNTHITFPVAYDMIRIAYNNLVVTVQPEQKTNTKAKTKTKAKPEPANANKVVILESVDDANTAKAHNKKRAIRILLAREGIGAETRKTLADALDALSANEAQPKQQTPSPQKETPKKQQNDATDIANSLKNIKMLDELFLKYELNLDYEWSKDELDDRLKDLEVPVQGYQWHGDRSLQRIVAQYAAFNVDDPLDVTMPDKQTFDLFTTSTDQIYTTKWLLDFYKDINTEKEKARLYNENLALYYTCLFVTALRDQNFGALFTSQPNFAHKPFNDDDKTKSEYDSAFDSKFSEYKKTKDDRIRPNCKDEEGGSRSEITVIKHDELTIDLTKIGKAVSFVNGLIKAGVLTEREENQQKKLLEYEETLGYLDDKLADIDENDIGKYTKGGAGDSTGYTAMLGQSMKCFVMFLPLIERWLRKQQKYKSENDDFIRSKALSYGCVSHGLDPKHIIAVRYAMTQDEGTYNANSYPLSRQICNELFDLLEKEDGETTFPVTRELMRTRALGAITVIEDVNRKLYQENHEKPKGKGQNRNGKSQKKFFGRVRSEHKRASMFI